MDQLCVAAYAEAVYQTRPGYSREQVIGEAYFWRQWNEDEQRILHGRTVAQDAAPAPALPAAVAPSMDLSFTHAPFPLL